MGDQPSIPIGPLVGAAVGLAAMSIAAKYTLDTLDSIKRQRKRKKKKSQFSIDNIRFSDLINKR